MIRVFLLLLACIAGSWYLADTIKQHGPGYVLVAYNDYTIETSVWVALAVLIVLAGLVYATAKLVRILFHWSARLGLLPDIFNRYQSLRLEYRGTQAFLDQNWQAAGDQLTRAARLGTTPFFDHLMAARSFLALHNLPEAEKSLQRARLQPDADATSLSLLSLDIAILKGDLSATYQLLNSLLDKSAGNPAVLSRAIAVYSAHRNWQALQPLLPRIRKQHLLDDAAFLQLEADIAAGLIASAPAARLSLPQLKTVLKDFGKVSTRPEVVHSYCSALAASGETAEAERLARRQLEEAWDNRLITFYAGIRTGQPQQQLAFAERFLPAQKNNPALLQSLARLAMASQLWGKARDYLQQALHIQPTVENCRLMAEVCEATHDANGARNYLKQGLDLALAQSRPGGLTH